MHATRYPNPARPISTVHPTSCPWGKNATAVLPSTIGLRIGPASMYATQHDSGSPFFLVNLNGVLIFALLWRVWTAQPPASMIVGFYLILTGLTRFVEEHHRGEPQTKVHAGLHSYQWLCVAMFAAGAICTCLPSPLALPADAAPPSAWLVSLAVGLIYAFAMGVDLPASNRRFSLLVPRT